METSTAYFYVCINKELKKRRLISNTVLLYTVYFLVMSEEMRVQTTGFGTFSTNGLISLFLLSFFYPSKLYSRGKVHSMFLDRL